MLVIFGDKTMLWGETRCAGCDARLSTWADEWRGCCALCGSPFPTEFALLHAETRRNRETATEHAQVAARRSHMEWLRPSVELYLEKYVKAQQEAGQSISRLELIAHLRVELSMSWIDSREYVEMFLAKNQTIPVTGGTQQAQDIIREDIRRRRVI